MNAVFNSVLNLQTQWRRIVTLRSFYKLILAAGFTLCFMPQAFAAGPESGTIAGTSIANTASVDYTVDDVNQPDVTSNEATFLVDRLINVTVAESGGAATPSAPGSGDQVTTFTVTNNSNSVQDFRLTATQQTGGAAGFGGDDNFDATPIAVFVESGDNVGYQADEDIATFIDELGADEVATVYIVADIPVAQVNGDVADVTLTATAAQSTSGTGAYVATADALADDAAETNTGSADDPAFIDTVFGDTDGDTDDEEDGKHSDDDQYDVTSASLTVTKTPTVVSDPFNGTTNPKAIPGAVVEYCLDVNNEGDATANAIILTDAMPPNTTYVPGSIKSAATGTGTACDLGSGTIEDDNSTDADEAPIGGNFSGTTVTVTAPSVAPDSRFKASFRVTID